MHGYLVMGDVIPSRGKEREICQLVMTPLRKLPQPPATGALFPGEEDRAAALAYKENMFVDFHGGAPGFLERERVGVVGGTEILDGTLQAIGRTGGAV